MGVTFAYRSFRTQMGDKGSALYFHVLLLFGNIGWKAGRGEKDVFGLEESIFNEII